MNWADLHFLRPTWLLALLPAAWLFWLLWRNRLAGGSWSQICDSELLPYLLESQASPKQRQRLIGAVLATFICIFALAGPTWNRLPSPAFRNDSALVIALDLSKSMNASDTKPSRLTKARYKIADLLKLRKDGQTALLVFGGDAFTVTPLTNDNQTINSQLEALTTAIMPSPGSNLQLAITKAGELLHQSGLTQGHILLVTDSEVADAKPANDYSLSVLGVGSEGGAPVPIPGGGFLKDGSGNLVIAKLDSAGLAALATSGNGLYQAASAGDDDIQHLSALFNRAEPGSSREQADLQLDQWEDLGPWLTLLLLPWAALCFRKGLLSLALLCLLLPLPRPAQAFDWQHLWQTADQQAQQAFANQQYEQAASDFENPKWRAAAQYRAGQYQEAAQTLKDQQSADDLYNRGNALAKAGELQPAIDTYREALKLDPNHADAKYNKELVEQALEKQKQKQQQQQGQNQQGDDQQKDQRQNQDGQNQPQDQDQAKQQEQQNQQQQANQQQNGDKQEQNDAEAKAAEPTEEQENKDKQGQAQQAASAEQQAQNEAQRAHQQMLKRIPDQPTGLLKRKFRYQYRQQQRSITSSQDW